MSKRLDIALIIMGVMILSVLFLMFYSFKGNKYE